jgi:hypothetical protein
MWLRKLRFVVELYLGKSSRTRKKKSMLNDEVDCVTKRGSILSYLSTTFLMMVTISSILGIALNGKSVTLRLLNDSNIKV